MALRRCDIIVRDARLQSGDKAYSSTTGIRLSEWHRWMNDAQTAIYQKLLNCHSSLYTRQIVLPVTPGLATVPIPSTNPNAVNITANIVNVSYSFDGTAQNYYKLNLRTPSQEVSINAYPEGYFLRDGNIVLTPIPGQNGGSLRVDFQYNLPSIDVRRALISGATTSSLTFTINSTLVQETEDDFANGYIDYVSVVDKDGTILASGMPITVYNSTTKVLSATLTAAQVAAITLGTSWLVYGKYATTNSQLLDTCERYVAHYVAWMAQLRNSNSEATATKVVLNEIEEEIMESISDLEEDLTAIPLLDTSYFYEL